MQAFNPYLPNYEYVPDGEPHVFGDRLYVFGSHDRFNGRGFCLNDYVAWSAPVDDLGSWHYEGVIYKKTQDPDNADGKYAMYAPDVAQGPDGRYYLYYGLADQYKLNVAVCDTVAGEYQYYGCVQHADGTPWGSKETDFMPFDPGIMVDDDGRIHLYAGQGPMSAKAVAKDKKKRFRDSAYYVELDPDMKTIKRGPIRLLPNPAESAGTGFEQHEFFEANSIRKFNDKYYFIYSSVQSHELCYAMSDRPDGDFKYGGTLHSNGDIGIGDFFPMSYGAGKADKRIKNYIANNHGSIVEVKGKYYIFGHRHTNASMFSRQGVAEEITMNEDGSFNQAEMTSCGLNGGPLEGIGTYSASIACNLQSKDGGNYSMAFTQGRKCPKLTQDGADRESDPGQYIANMRDGALAGFKYFDFNNFKPVTISVKVRGKAEGQLMVCSSEDCGKPLAVIPIAVSDKKTWQTAASTIAITGAKTPLYFIYKGSGAVDLLEFTLD